MQAREALVAIIVVIVVAVIGGTLLRRRRKSRPDPDPPAEDAQGDRWLVSKNEQHFGPVTFDQLRAYARDGLVTRSDLIKRAGAQAWTRARDIRDLFPLPPPVPTAPAVRRPAEIALSAQDRVAAPPVSEAQALRHVTAETLRHAAGQDPDPPQWSHDRSAKDPGGDVGRKRRNYFAGHWRGELSLPVSYWINGILAGIAAVLVVEAINTSVDFKDDFQPGLALAAEILVWATTSLIAVWRLVGVWRSATNYQRAGKKFWGPAAKVLVIVGAAESIAGFALVDAPQINELYKIYRGDEEIGGYAFRVLRDGRELEFSGGITFGAAKDFQRFLDAMPAVQVVHLNSPGGRIAEAAGSDVCFRPVSSAPMWSATSSRPARPYS